MREAEILCVADAKSDVVSPAVTETLDDTLKESATFEGHEPDNVLDDVGTRPGTTDIVDGPLKGRARLIGLSGTKSQMRETNTWWPGDVKIGVPRRALEDVGVRISWLEVRDDELAHVRLHPRDGHQVNWNSQGRKGHARRLQPREIGR